jgi:hypothetical protein
MRPRKALLPLALGVAGAFGLLVSHGAEARVEAEAQYSKAQTFSAALRYLRVDLNYDVLEKDPEAAYLIFKYQSPSQPRQSSTGTLEIVEGDAIVRIYVKLPQLPEYHERVLRDGLLRKLREEYGEPRRRKPPPKEQPPGDAGAD